MEGKSFGFGLAGRARESVALPGRQASLQTSQSSWAVMVKDFFAGQLGGGVMEVRRIVSSVYP